MKNSYILLRDNKESHALSIEELQEIGLKKTDLIWVECQSMGWRSPFEIAELKSLVITNFGNDIKNNQEKLFLKKVPERERMVKQEKSGETLTASDTNNLGKYNYPERVILSGSEKKKIDSRLHNGTSPWGIINEEPLTNAKQKVDRNNKVFSFQLAKPVKKIAFYFGLIVTGALLMLVIQDLGSKKTVTQQQEIPQPEKNPILNSTIPNTLNKNNSIIQKNNIEPPGSLTQNGLVSTKKDLKKPAKPAHTIPLNTNAKSDIQDTSNNVKKNTPPVTVLNVKPVRLEDISSKISLKANDYNVGFFGGIRNLTLTLQNNSGYMLDKVNVEIQYLNQNSKIISVDEIYFQNVKAGDAQDVKVDRSKRGVKVNFQITHIDCKAITIHQ